MTADLLRVRRVPRLAAAALVLFLAACATVPPGEDPRGRELKAQATPVLAALVSFHKDRGEYPVSLHELVPRYLREVPFGPGLRFDRDSRVIEFVYAPAWHDSRKVLCFARAGELEWSCR